MCDTLLRRAPVNVFLFDTDLVCRYAAPIGDEFMGRPRDELVGRHAAEIWPPAANGLRPVLERAVREAAGWQDAEYRFVHQLDGAELPCCWSIQVDPLEVDDQRVVMVSWSDMLSLLDERDELRARVQAEAAARRERQAALTALLSDLRNLLTPVSGYLQVIVRRPALLGGRPAQDVLRADVLPRLSDVVAALDRLRQPPIFADDDGE